MEFKWTQIEQDEFNEIKRIVAHDTLLARPYFNKKINIHTDDINFQLVALIIHKGKPIVFYSQELTDYQKSYIVTKKYF